MAGNFWKSSHYEQWLLEKYDLLRERGEDLKIFTEDEYQKIMIFFCNFIVSLGMDWNYCRYRQPVIATACVYFRRFYARRSFKDVDPFLLAPTCLMLAAKVEEQGMHTSSKYIQYVQQIIVKKYPFMSDIAIKSSHLQEAEFFLLEIMDCCLVVYQPYRPLQFLFQEMKIVGLHDLDSLYNEAWRVVNDSLRTDASLLYAPHIIAIASIMVAAMATNRDKEKELRAWLSEFSVDFENVFEVIQMILNLYTLVKSYDERQQMEGLLKKLPRPSVMQNPQTPKMKVESKFPLGVMGGSTSKDQSIIARCSIPAYSVKSMGTRHVLVAGGGGPVKTGVRNEIQIFLLTYNQLSSLTNNNHKNNWLPSLRAKLTNTNDTGNAAIMNTDVLARDAHDSGRFYVAAGEDDYCSIFVTDEYTLNGEEDDEVERPSRLSLTLKRVLRFQTDKGTKDPYQKCVRFDCSNPNMPRLVSGGTDGHVRVWNLATMLKINNPNLPPTNEYNMDGEIEDVDFSYCGSTIAVVSTKRFELIDLQHEVRTPVPTLQQLGDAYKVRLVRFTRLSQRLLVFAVAYQQRQRTTKQSSYLALWTFNREHQSFKLTNLKELKQTVQREYFMYLPVLYMPPAEL